MGILARRGHTRRRHRITVYFILFSIIHHTARSTLEFDRPTFVPQCVFRLSPPVFQPGQRRMMKKGGISARRDWGRALHFSHYSMGRMCVAKHSLHTRNSIVVVALAWSAQAQGSEEHGMACLIVEGRGSFASEALGQIE